MRWNLGSHATAYIQRYRPLLSSSLVLIGLLLGAQSSWSAGVTDTGDVVVDADGNLIVGATDPGARLIDGVDDGPYSNVVVGGNYPGPPNSIVVDHGGSLTSQGDLSLASLPEFGFSDLTVRNASRVQTSLLETGNSEAGYGGGVSIRIESGSSLLSENARLWTYSDVPVSVTVIDPGSSWINDGSVSANGFRGTTVSIEEGAYARFGTVDWGSEQVPATLAVSGIGSVIDTGDMWVEAHTDIFHPRAGVEILSGGTMNSTQVILTSRTETEAIVQGDGSQWNIDGALAIVPDDGRVSLVVSDGGVVTSRSASISGPIASVRIDGQGSSWVSGPLELNADFNFEHDKFIAVTDGGLLHSDSVLISEPPYSWLDGGFFDVNVDGPGSEWIADGPVSASAGENGRVGIAVSNGALATFRDSVSIGNSSHLSLDDGTVLADTVRLDGGSLSGRGAIDGNVVNDGVLDIEASGEPSLGVMLIHGSYEQTDSGRLDILLDRGFLGDSELLDILGAAVLDGELAISLADGFLPEIGDAFLILGYASRVGEFDQISGLDLAGDLSLRPVYGALGMSLVTVPEPGTAFLLGIGLIGLARRGAARHPKC